MSQINVFLFLVASIMLLGLYSIKWVLQDYDRITEAIESGKEDEDRGWDIWDIGWHLIIFVLGFAARSMI